ncbi:hypothetical protein HF086_002805 [Spodoptera exigua]|uniref:MICOS complex subunit MIC10 n=1 Tax=Spodoptera exigua TaxID=7107 RepID=A0A922M9N4_SPOEX|nr:hypothetical protein HF086_002805 [Spodoptera exigua]
MSQSAADVRDFEERYSACFVDFGLKTVFYLYHVAAGLLIGSMVGSFFLRGFKKWPMYIGGGLGFGMAYTNCENSLNHYLLSQDPKVCVIKQPFVSKIANVDCEDEIAFEIANGTNYSNKNIEKELKRDVFGGKVVVVLCIEDNEEVIEH